MQVELSENEITDIRRGLILAMKQLDATKNGPDIILSDRLEVIEQRLRNIK